jgi:hypothetical protein
MLGTHDRVYLFKAVHAVSARREVVVPVLLCFFFFLFFSFSCAPLLLEKKSRMLVKQFVLMLEASILRPECLFVAFSEIRKKVSD